MIAVPKQQSPHGFAMMRCSRHAAPLLVESPIKYYIANRKKKKKSHLFFIGSGRSSSSSRSSVFAHHSFLKRLGLFQLFLQFLVLAACHSTSGRVGSGRIGLHCCCCCCSCFRFRCTAIDIRQHAASSYYNSGRKLLIKRWSEWVNLIPSLLLCM